MRMSLPNAGWTDDNQKFGSGSGESLQGTTSGRRSSIVSEYHVLSLNKFWPEDTFRQS